MQTYLFAAVIAFTTSFTWGQLTIPSRELGLAYKDGQAYAEVKLATYIDLTCPYSQAAYPTLLQVADQYTSNQVQLKVYLFSLPYHRNSHTISKAANVINLSYSPKNATVYDWITAVYDNIDSLTTAATVDKTDTDVLNFLTNLVYNVSGISAQEFQAGVANTDIDHYTRLVGEYGCTRGVYATPSFTVNDVFVDADSSWTVSQWTSLIDNLLNSKKNQKSFVKVN